MRRPKKKLIALCLLSAAFLSFAACSEKQKTDNLPPDKDIPLNSLVIGVLPEQNVFVQKKRYKPLAGYLSTSIGMNVRTRLLDSYDAIYSEMTTGKLDAAFFGSLNYTVMDSRLPIEPIARPQMRDGVSTYRGLIFTLKNSGITDDVKTWKNKRIALVNKSTTAGYLFPKWHLYQRGVKNFEGYFRKVIYTGSHDASILAVFYGDVDIGCAKDLIFNKFLEENPQIREKLTVIATSLPVPSNTLGVNKDVDPKLRERLKDALLNADRTSEGKDALSLMGAARFIETKQTEYGPVYEMLRDLGLKPTDFAEGAGYKK